MLNCCPLSHFAFVCTTTYTIFTIFIPLESTRWNSLKINKGKKVNMIRTKEYFLFMCTVFVMMQKDAMCKVFGLNLQKN